MFSAVQSEKPDYPNFWITSDDIVFPNQYKTKQFNDRTIASVSEIYEIVKFLFAYTKLD